VLCHAAPLSDGLTWHTMALQVEMDGDCGAPKLCHGVCVGRAMPHLRKLFLFGLATFALAACEGKSDSEPQESSGGTSTGDSPTGRTAAAGTVCFEPSVVEPPEGCGSGSLWIRSSGGGSDCVATFEGCVPDSTDGGSWLVFDSPVDCQSLLCKAGDTRPAGDGCNTCNCEVYGGAEKGYWKCTNKACGSSVATGKDCGYFQGACGSGEYCAYSPEEACSSFDASSICMTQPSECTTEDAPVCGCDGKPYVNRCEAARAGTGIRYMGPCPRNSNVAIPCGSRARATCTDSEYCAYKTGDLCGRTDVEATCRPRPAECIVTDAPVCGCDGKTYKNACEAAKAGTGVLNEGACCSK